jgi:hypothetical protein
VSGKHERKQLLPSPVAQLIPSRASNPEPSLDPFTNPIRAANPEPSVSSRAEPASTNRRPRHILEQGLQPGE